ncbi:DUF3108 domain-containing protein [Caminibacter sp.]
MRIVFFLIIGILAYSKTLIATYTAKYGWFGTIAMAKGVYDRNLTNYRITNFVQTTGFARTFVDLKEYYISEGNITNNILVPNIYKNIIIRNGKKYLLIYKFDYKNRKIIKTKYKEGKFVYKREMPFFAKNDILTLYFNLPLIMHSKRATFKALGGEKHTGRVDVEILKKTPKITKIKANLYNKVFAGDKGILYLDINTSNWVTLKGMVKNVLKIGDLKGELKSFKQVP